MTRAVEVFERRYVRGGAVRHLLVDSEAAVAVCGMGPWVHDQWYGTGSQVEYETVASLPDCRLCLARQR